MCTCFEDECANEMTIRAHLHNATEKDIATEGTEEGEGEKKRERRERERERRKREKRRRRRKGG